MAAKWEVLTEMPEMLDSDVFSDIFVVFHLDKKFTLYGDLYQLEKKRVFEYKLISKIQYISHIDNCWTCKCKTLFTQYDNWLSRGK